MQVAKGTAVGGKAVFSLSHGSFPDGAEAAVFSAEQNNTVRLPPAHQRELEGALAEADQTPGIFAEELFAELRKYGLFHRRNFRFA